MTGPEFVVFFESQRPDLTRFAKQLCNGHKFDHEALVQEVFLKCFPRCASIVDVKHGCGYLFVATRRKFVDWLRSEPVPINVESDIASFAAQPTPFEIAEAEDVAKAVQLLREVIRKAAKKMNGKRLLALKTWFDVKGDRTLAASCLGLKGAEQLRNDYDQPLTRAKATLRELLNPHSDFLRKSISWEQQYSIFAEEFAIACNDSSV